MRAINRVLGLLGEVFSLPIALSEQVKERFGLFVGVVIALIIGALAYLALTGNMPVLAGILLFVFVLFIVGLWPDV